MSDPLKGRGSRLRPDNPWSQHQVDDSAEHSQLVPADPAEEPARGLRTEFLDDHAKSIISTNDSPDIPFRYSLNPYRGCEHGCSYCYARPGHEYLGFNAGIDFESKIFVKRNAARLLRTFLAKPGWDASTIVFSGVTDCYQPVERELKLTRACLEVAAECHQPVSIITKNALLLRDIDLLKQMADEDTVRVAVSITTLDTNLARVLEPRTSAPSARLRMLQALSEAKIPAMAMLAPVIPGLTDSEIPAILEAAATAGATSAGYLMLRLPRTVEPVFLEWLERERPGEAPRIRSRLQAVRDGALNDSHFGRRMRGTGPIAEQIAQTFRVFRQRYGLQTRDTELRRDLFRRPEVDPRQLRLF